MVVVNSVVPLVVRPCEIELKLFRVRFANDHVVFILVNTGINHLSLGAVMIVWFNHRMRWGWMSPQFESPIHMVVGWGCRSSVSSMSVLVVGWFSFVRFGWFFLSLEFLGFFPFLCLFTSSMHLCVAPMGFLLATSRVAVRWPLLMQAFSKAVCV